MVMDADERARSVAYSLQRLKPVHREIERLARFAEPYRSYAYCFCAAP
jgi:hypothetical protein